jgi:glycosyltransferase involved in cell wall biosynthesis
MPVHDEEQALPDVLAEAVATLDALSDRWELIVVDDGSGDGTPEILREHAARDDRIRVLTQRGNLGYGMALRRGFDAVRYLVVAFTDADGQYDLADLATLYPFLRDADMVAGFRVSRQDPWHRRLSAAVYGALVGLLLGVRARDPNCALKMFRRSFLYMIDLSSDGFLIDAELFVRARAAGLRWAQVGVTHRPRRHGRSKIGPHLWWPSFRALLELRRSL